MTELRLTAPKPGPAAWIGQAALYALFALVIGVLSRWPAYHPIAANEALIKLSFSHTGKPVADCRKQSAEALAKLPPNMRAPMVCPRERSPVTVALDLDGKPVLRQASPPSGLSHDGPSSIYVRLPVRAGEQRIAVRVNDDARVAGFTHVAERVVQLEPAQTLVIDFDAEKGGITMR